MSIRLRLTLLYTGVLVAVLVGLSAALYVGQERQTVRLVDRALIGAANAALGPAGRAQAPGPPGPLEQRPRIAAVLLQTRDVNGTVLERSAGLGESVMPISAEGLEAVQSGKTTTERVKVEDVPMLVFSEPVVVGGTVVGIVQAGASLSLMDKYLQGLRLSLLLVSGLAAAVAFLGGWFLAGEALRPIHRITHTAREIGRERDFSQRVAHTGPNDEIGELARTFNDMLAELQAAYQNMAETLQTQRQFVADASHELRTPLTTIRGNAELLGLDPPIPRSERRAALADIVSETDRLIGLVADLLVLARADAGRKPASEPVALDPLVADLLRQARLLAPDRAVTQAVEPGLVAVGDRDALRQILLNLLENAFRHTPVTATVRLEAKGQADAVVLRVADSGPGIAPEDLDRVFERFQRGHAARTGPGSGLGLSIARALTEAQGGTIEVTSTVGVGTAFTVRLPREAGVSSSHAPSPGA